LAALAATSAFAQSSVTISGNLDQTYYNQNGERKWIHNGNSTSLIMLSGTEDLGGGLKAKFALTSELNLMAGQAGAGSTGARAANGQTPDMWNRGANVTLEDSKLGGVTVGRQTDNWFSTSGAFNTAGSASFGSGATLSYVGNTAALGKVTNFTGATHLPGYTADASGNGNTTFTGANAANDGNTGTAAQVFKSGVGYTSPTISGFTFGYLRGQQTMSGYANYGTSWALNYANGPLKAGYAITDNKDANGESAWKQTFAGVSYNMGKVTLIANNNKTKFGGTAAAVPSLTANAIGVNYVFSDKIDANLSYATIKDDSTANNKGTITGVTARYALSKRSSLYAGFGKTKNEGTQMNIGAIYGATTNVDKNASANAAMIGIKHTF
jgi:predicted porin